VTDVWIVVVVVGVATMLFKAAGPVVLGTRPLPPRVRGVVDLLAPVMLTSLVVTQTFGGDETIAVDARVPGVLAGGIAVWRGVHLIPAMVIAAVVTAAVRQVGG
jgi:branched-subunit amino acid transport protein